MSVRGRGRWGTARGGREAWSEREGVLMCVAALHLERCAWSCVPPLTPCPEAVNWLPAYMCVVANGLGHFMWLHANTTRSRLAPSALSTLLQGAHAVHTP